MKILFTAFLCFFFFVPAMAIEMTPVESLPQGNVFKFLELQADTETAAVFVRAQPLSNHPCPIPANIKTKKECAEGQLLMSFHFYQCQNVGCYKFVEKGLEVSVLSSVFRETMMDHLSVSYTGLFLFDNSFTEKEKARDFNTLTLERNLKPLTDAVAAIEEQAPPSVVVIDEAREETLKYFVAYLLKSPAPGSAQ